MEKMAIFISTPDSYSDVLQVFLECFKKNWDDCPYELIISTNSNKYDNATVYNNGRENDGWMDRAIPVLKNINYEYVLLMCDDCLILDKVETVEIRHLLEDIIENQIDFCGLSNHVSGKKKNKDSKLVYVRNNKAYAKNLQTGIYRREYLLKILGNGDKTPWDLEQQWLKEAAHANGDYFDNIASCATDILHCKNGVLKGKWYSSVLKAVSEAGISVTSKREIIQPVEEIKLSLFSKLGKLMPSSMRRRIKKAMGKIGFSFASEE